MAAPIDSFPLSSCVCTLSIALTPSSSPSPCLSHCWMVRRCVNVFIFAEEGLYACRSVCKCVFVCVCVHLCVKAALFLIEGKLSRAVWKIQGHWSPVTCAVWERACVIECLWESLSLSFSLSGCVTEKEASGKEQRISSGFPSMYGKGDCVSAWLCVYIW